MPPEKQRKQLSIQEELYLITIIDSGISNLKSITRGFVTQGYEVQVTANPADVRAARSLVLPGVGAFPKAMEVLEDRGLVDAIREHAASGRPLIGICLGMHLLFADSSEHIRTEGLGLIPGHVIRFPADRPVPHMGWNEVVQTRESPLFNGIPDHSDFYFVHSYYVQIDFEEDTIGVSDHFGRFPAVVQRKNIYGTQFHPEKSQKNGLTLLRNFAKLGDE
jgi:glutamine amidotransferase